MRVALFTPSQNSNTNYNNNYASRYVQSFGRVSSKIPKPINDAFISLCKKVEQMPERGKVNSSLVKLFENESESAFVVVERKRQNWFLSFLFDNFRLGIKSDVTYSKGDKTAIQALLRAKKTKQELTKFLDEMGVEFNSI